MKSCIFKLVVVALFIVGVHSHFEWSNESISEKNPAKTSIGNVRTLWAAYNQWKTQYVRDGGAQKLHLRLAYTKALSVEVSNARGEMTLDLTDGSLFVNVSGLSDRESFDVWLLNDRPDAGGNAKAEPGDRTVHVGRLKHIDGTATLNGRLSHEALAGFEINLVAVGRSGKPPRDAGLLFGSPSLFQRFYYSEQRAQLASLDDSNQPRNRESILPNFLSAPFRILIPRPAYAQEENGKLDLSSTMEALVARGENLFFNETFGGNGRTCGTCHPSENNLTIDPEFIATLPSNDPLFVAEFNPNLKCDPKCRFENPTLMREFGLILENVDGLDDLDRFALRGVPHTLALSTSITRPPSTRSFHLIKELVGAAMALLERVR